MCQFIPLPCFDNFVPTIIEKITIAYRTTEIKTIVLVFIKNQSRCGEKVRSNPLIDISVIFFMAKIIKLYKSVKDKKTTATIEIIPDGSVKKEKFP